jgi:hypothetical protein
VSVLLRPSRPGCPVSAVLSLLSVPLWLPRSVYPALAVCSSCSVLAVFSFLSCPGCVFLVAVCWHPVQAALSWQPRPGSPVLSAPSWQPRPCSPVLAAPSCQPVLAAPSWQPRPGSPVLAAPSWQPRPGSPVLAVRFRLPFPGYPVLAVLFWLSYSGGPVLAVLSLLYIYKAARARKIGGSECESVKF